MEWTNCELCGGEDFTLLFQGRDWQYFSPLTFKVMQCRACGLVCLNPRPREMMQYYPEGKKESIKDYFDFLQPNRIKKIARLKKKGRVLDIGCGWGEFLFQMSKQGWGVFGTDISKTRCDFAREKLRLNNVYNSGLCSLDFPQDFFDLVTMWHTLEHLDRPQETLRTINRILKDDGVLIIESPNFASPQSRFFKERHYQLDLPRHLYWFTPHVLEKLLKLAGFKIYKRDYIVNPRICFISLKMSLSRCLGVRKLPVPGAITSFRQTRILWDLLSWTFNLLCLALTSFLILINCDDSFRVYCRKMTRG